MTVIQPNRLLHPANLDVLLTTENAAILTFNQQELMLEAIKHNVSPIHQTPFLFDIYDPHCYVFTDEEYYHHLLKLIKRK